MPLADKFSWTQKCGKSAFDERYFIAGLCQNSKTLPWKTHHLWIPCYREVQSSWPALETFLQLYETRLQGIMVLVSSRRKLAIVWFELGGAGMAQWWERSLPSNVSRVRFPDSASYVGWVCCWFSSLLREVFPRVLRFSPLLKNQHFQTQF